MQPDPLPHDGPKQQDQLVDAVQAVQPADGPTPSTQKGSSLAEAALADAVQPADGPTPSTQNGPSLPDSALPDAAHPVNSPTPSPQTDAALADSLPEGVASENGTSHQAVQAAPGVHAQALTTDEVVKQSPFFAASTTDIKPDSSGAVAGFGESMGDADATEGFPPEMMDSFDDCMENMDTLEFLDLPDIFHEFEADEDTDRLDDYELLDVGDIDLNVFKNIWSPKRILLRDKVTFLLGSTELWVCAYWMGHSPSSFYQFYIIEAVVLFAARYVVYSRRKWHYYLFDFCYYANLLLLTHLFFFPSSRLLNKAMFAYTTGPLAWSIPAFRNSLVYHDLDKVTSVFLHLVPTCVSWTLRWYPDPERFPLFDSCKGRSKDDCARALNAEHEPASFLELVLVPLGPYIVWAVLYYLKIFVISAKRIQQRKYKTLFDYITTAKKGVFANITRRVPISLRPLIYFALHLLFCVFTFTFSLLLWHNFFLHSGFIIAVTCLSIWHGGNYYFEVFAKKYVSTLQQQHADDEPSTPKKKAD